MALSCRTKGDSTPQGKPRVYFSCHPLDFSMYFDILYDDIQKTQNCAVWYKEGGGAPDETELADLEQMQLFVLPVTARLLTQPSRALEVEFPLALARHIPVLPILLESGLEGRFNQKCGELQFLDRTASDPTAEPYSVKLEKYLSAVLVGDELAQKIREAFDAYIFLSYRKKDRRHARELMRLIHQNDFCRDMAIWYDEYLTPGEDFNSAIADALNKSDLFALLVTPNLLEKGNYVAAHEYPAVQKTDKPVLPAEAVSTDREALEEAYPAIPPCVDAHSAPALSASLLEAVQKLALRENDADPRHNFFIGLAYLSGIDVEVDRERGVALITGAAEAGLAEAMGQLVKMHRAGQAVERDSAAAIRWQERLVEKLGARCRQSGAPEDAEEYLRALWDLGDYCYERRDLEGAKSAFERMRALSESLSSDEDAVRAQIRSTAYERLGSMARAEGRTMTALDHYNKSLDICLFWVNKTGRADWELDAAILYDRLGNLHQDSGRPKDALDCYTKALELRQRALRQEDTRRRAKWYLSVSYGKQGDVFRGMMRFKESAQYYKKALDAVRSLRAEQDTPELQIAACSHLNNLAYVLRGQNEEEQAAMLYREALEIGMALYERWDSADVSRCLQISHEGLGDLLMNAEEYAQAGEHFERSLELSLTLAELSDIPEVRRDLALSYDRVGDVYLAEDEADRAEDAFRKSFELKCGLFRETASQENGKHLAVSHQKLGDVCRCHGDPAAARDHYAEAIGLLERFNTLENRIMMAMIYNLLGLVNGPDGGWDRGSLDRAMEIWDELLGEHPMNPVIRFGRETTQEMLRDCPKS